MARRPLLVNALLTILLAFVLVVAGTPTDEPGPDASAYEIGPDGEPGTWDELGEDGRVWMPLEPGAGDALPPGDLGAYHNYDEMVVVLEELAAERPEVFTLLPVGATVEGRTLYMMRVAAPANTLTPRLVLLDGAHHGNEVIGSEILVRLLKDIHARFDDDAEMQSLLGQVILDVVPMVNADSVQRIPQCSSYATCRKNTNGVDLNRNYPDHWGGSGSSNNPGSAVYHGPAPLSEPETQAISRLMNLHPYTLHASFHSGVELILWPYGWTTSPPPDAATFQELGQRLSLATGGVPHGQTSRILYLAAGTTMDQSYGSALVGRALAFSPEVYRGGGNGWDWWLLFNPPETEAGLQPVVAKWHDFIWHLVDEAPGYLPLLPVSNDAMPAPAVPAT